MFFSKSFGYALRGVLYVAAAGNSRKIRIEELAYQLQVPRHFMGKVMKSLVKQGVLNSVKGPSGGFFINANTLNTPLLRVIEITDGLKQFDHCVLRLEKCNKGNPCPLHHEMEKNNHQLSNLFSKNTVGDLLKVGSKKLIESLT